MDELGEGVEVFGPIHDDLSARNILVHANEIRLIDFVICQWGYDFDDIADAFRLASSWISLSFCRLSTRHS